MARFRPSLHIALAICSTLLLSTTACTASRETPSHAERRIAADWILMVADVGDAYAAAPRNLQPAFPHWKSLPAQWRVEGHLVGNDRPPLHDASKAPIPTMHGVLARTDDAHGNAAYAVLLRGTVGTDEWEIDAFFPHRAGPWPDSGKVPGGFLDLYESLAFVPRTGDAQPTRAAEALRNHIGEAPVTVVGHSAGAVLGTYLTLDLVHDATTNRVAGRFFASARPGDAAFAAAYARAVTDHRAYDNVRDLVPHLPPDLGPDGFKPLANITPLDPTRLRVHLRDTPGCNHHAVSYAALLDFARMPLAAWQARLADSQQPRDCLVPVPPHRTLLP
ncbi:hypothetical protein LYSHEL_19670 [Lysobacter helvus]|uniref:Fungal lipase-type domain-containing protein n=2 Tax=Lysobacteraceae TaxID=32033 RepID=A0ABM7Q6J2_9GAMM|nr:MULTISPECIES: hypothetical protein [Lysobacter]BCT92944.1 hypothetical protein LYSCAS_19680 [Lysobacter caseinilyticus]BCT96096.1 hypothetical protein LYSHEL_19670 [Lysobacter helvus]